MIVTDSVDDFNNYINNKNKHIFVLFYMKECGPCEIVHPIWKKIKNNLDLKNDNIIIADIEQSKAQDLLTKYSVTEFPTIKYIKNNKSEDYNGDRTIDSFITWIKSKFDKTGGGRKTKGRKTKGRKRKYLN